MFILIEKERKTSCEAILERHCFVYLDTWCNAVMKMATDGWMAIT